MFQYKYWAGSFGRTSYDWKPFGWKPFDRIQLDLKLFGRNHFNRKPFGRIYHLAGFGDFPNIVCQNPFEWTPFCRSPFCRNPYGSSSLMDFLHSLKTDVKDKTPTRNVPSTQHVFTICFWVPAISIQPNGIRPINTFRRVVSSQSANRITANRHYGQAAFGQSDYGQMVFGLMGFGQMDLRQTEFDQTKFGQTMLDNLALYRHIRPNGFWKNDILGQTDYLAEMRLGFD